jgi:GNAT superfamily N-acetyltransferase
MFVRARSLHLAKRMHNPSISLRAVTPADEALLFRVYATTRDEELAVVPFTPQEKHAFLRMQFAARQREYAARFSASDRAVIEWEGAPIGYCWLHRGDDEIRIVDVALLPEHRGEGLGTELLTALIAEARERGVAVRLQVLANSAARRRYERMGFAAVGDSAQHQLMELVPQGAPALAD